MKDIKLLFEKAASARLNAYAPYSHFLVGSCLETDQGELFSACNVENASYGLSVCAESNAIAAMVAAGAYKIKQIVVVVQGPQLSAPCGACRQRIYEFATPDTAIHLMDTEGHHLSYTMRDLLTHAFGPADLV